LLAGHELGQLVFARARDLLELGQDTAALRAGGRFPAWEGLRGGFDGALGVLLVGAG
jgi:hypothetical protein